MGLFSHDDENKQPQDQAPAGIPDDGQVPTDAGAAGGVDDVQGAMPPQQPPVDQPPVDNGVPGVTPPEGGDADTGVSTGLGEEEGDDQVPPAAPQQ